MTPRISRRHLLRGAGVALSLPWLEYFLPRSARAEAQTAPRRYISLYFPNGVAEYWRPKLAGSGAAWTLSPILEPLAAVKPYVTVLSNVTNTPTWGTALHGPTHSNCCSGAWTCVAPNGPGNVDSSISVDQVIAQAIGGQSTLASLQVGLSTLHSDPDQLPGQHSRSISWKSATEPLYKIVNPQAVFDRLTGQAAASSQEQRALRESVLDYVLDNAQALQRKLGGSDRRRLDQYLTSVRSLEQRVTAPEMRVAAAGCKPSARPTDVYGVGNVPAGYDRNAHAELMIELVVMAFACDVTRVVSFMLDDARSDFEYDFVTRRKFSDAGSAEAPGKIGGYHKCQHQGSRNDSFATIGHWNAQKAAQLAGKLAELREGDANLLENSIITFASGMHGGNHSPDDLPVALIGGGGKTGGGTVIKTDRHILFDKAQRLADVHLTIMQQVFGLSNVRFGSSTGAISALTSA